MEETLYYPDQYAGTADMIAVYEGKDVIVDFKQSNNCLLYTSDAADE